jgi:hypothetical protein
LPSNLLNIDCTLTSRFKSLTVWLLVLIHQQGPTPVLKLSGVAASGDSFAQGTALSLVATAVNSVNTDITEQLDYAWKLGDAADAISNLDANMYTYKCSTIGTNKISVASLATATGDAYH